MASDAKFLNELFAQQRDLNAEQTRISQQLIEVNQKIQYLLAVHANRASGAGAPVAIAAPVRGVKVSNGLRKNGTRHSWFDRGEAVKLIRRAARRSMRPAQVVHAVMDAKGYATLAGEEKKRAQSAIHQAVILAVKSGALTRGADGAVRVKA